MSKYKNMFFWDDGVSFTTKRKSDIPVAECTSLTAEHNKAIQALIAQIKDKPLIDTIAKTARPAMQRSKYHREIKPSVWVDVYQVLGAFTGDISERAKAAVDHAIKKLLAPGQRGVKSERQDLVEARDSLNRAIQLLDDWA